MYCLMCQSIHPCGGGTMVGHERLDEPTDGHCTVDSSFAPLPFLLGVFPDTWIQLADDHPRVLPLANGGCRHQVWLPATTSARGLHSPPAAVLRSRRSMCLRWRTGPRHLASGLILHHFWSGACRPVIPKSPAAGCGVLGEACGAMLVIARPGSALTIHTSRGHLFAEFAANVCCDRDEMESGGGYVS